MWYTSLKKTKPMTRFLAICPLVKSDSSLCIFGERITPNMHALARKFGWMDDYYASGKSSAEGHQWTDAGMVSDYVEKNVRAWFRSYPHRQTDALVYNKSGFIWNQALDHGKTVRVFGEACTTEYDRKLNGPIFMPITSKVKRQYGITKAPLQEYAPSSLLPIPIVTTWYFVISKGQIFLYRNGEDMSRAIIFPIS
jgi:hypothetical protein